MSEEQALGSSLGIICKIKPWRQRHFDDKKVQYMIHHRHTRQIELVREKDTEGENSALPVLSSSSPLTEYQNADIKCKLQACKSEATETHTVIMCIHVCTQEHTRG